MPDRDNPVRRIIIPETIFPRVQPHQIKGLQYGWHTYEVRGPVSHLNSSLEELPRMARVWITAYGRVRLVPAGAGKGKKKKDSPHVLALLAKGLKGHVTVMSNHRVGYILGPELQAELAENLRSFQSVEYFVVRYKVGAN